MKANSYQRIKQRISSIISISAACFAIVSCGGEMSQQEFKSNVYEQPKTPTSPTLPPSLDFNFGRSTALSGDTLVVGVSNDASNETGVKNGTAGAANRDFFGRGAVYVFRKSGNNWVQEAYLKNPVANQTDNFGGTVSISGDTIVVGASKESSNETGVKNGPLGGANNLSNGSGAAYVFKRTGNTWAQEAFLKGSATNSSDLFGCSVAISGDTIVVGANQEDSSEANVKNGASGSADNTLQNSGAAYVFKRTGSLWVQEAYLKASEPGAGDYFGDTVAISGETIVIGAQYEENPMDISINSGAAYVFRRSGANWAQEAYLKSSGISLNPYFGLSVAISDDTIVIGADGDDSNETGVRNGVHGALNLLSTESGAAYVFKRTGTIWTQEAYLKAENISKYDTFGSRVAISGDTILISAPPEASFETGVTNGSGGGIDNSLVSSGAAYVFRRTGNLWAQEAYLKGLGTSANDCFGLGIAISGNEIVVGAPFEDSDELGVRNGAIGGANDLLSSSGAAYGFTRTGTLWSSTAFFKRAVGN